MYKLISVPLDQSAESRHALPMAVHIAKRADCPIELVNVAFPAAVGTELYGAAVLHGQDIEAMRQMAAEQLRVAAADVERLGVRARSVTLVGGSLPKTLADHLHESNPDLVVMTTHDRSRLEHLLLGSVAESLVRRSHVPVLLLRASGGKPVLEQAPDIRHVLIALDGSAFAAQIVQHTVKLAKLRGADLSLLSVLEPVLATATAEARVERSGLTHHPDAGERPSLDAELLERAAEPLRAQGLAVQTTALVDAQPAKAIVEYATQHGIDLIAMTTHGRGALRRLVAGSVSQDVLRTWRGAMLMYRPELH
jgi:nucleotide-binding universal stress UspA family protein